MSTREPDILKKTCETADTWTLAYASSPARQMTREQMERQLHKADKTDETDKTRNKRDLTKIEATYNNLFKENWGEFCAHDDIASIDSPVAYLRALYLFAKQFDAKAKPGRKITDLRPDIAEQKIDASTVFESLSTLKLVNNVLGRKITNDAKNVSRKQALEIMSKKTKPLYFPYHHAHQQCVVALAAKNLGLGILDYKLRFEWPHCHVADSENLKTKELCKAQLKMSNLSNRQIEVLTVKLAEYIDRSDIPTGTANTVVNRSEINDGRYPLDLFASQTHCSPSETKQLLDLQVSKSYPSQNSHPVVEDIKGSELKNICLAHENDNAHLFTALDRLQRIIRLHRWSKISLGDLDTLVCNAISSDGSDEFISTSTLRALGVYQYFKLHYGIEAEEFAALLYRLPTQSVDGRTPLSDRVLRRNSLTANLFQQEGGEMEATIASLAEGMDLGISYHSLKQMAKLSKTYSKNLRQNLQTASSLYRQARIAKLFGLSPLECVELVNVLGGEAFKELLVSGKLGNDKPDILHLLMALDGVMAWLRSAGLTAAQLLRMLGQRVPFARETLPTHIAAIRAMRDASAEEPQRLAVQQMLQDVAGLSAQYIPCVMKMVNTSEQALCTQIRAGGILLLKQSLAAAEICQTLNLSSDVLLKLLNTPQLLKSGWNNVFALEDFYCLERFANYSRGNARAGGDLLGYLDIASTDEKNKANEALKDFLDIKYSLSSLTQPLSRERVENMQQLDWVTRHLEVCKSAGLALESLHETLALDNESSMDEWSTVAAKLLHAANV